MSAADGFPSDVLLVNPPYSPRRASGVIPPMGLAYVAAVLRNKGFRVEIADFAAKFPDFTPSRLAEVKETLASHLLAHGTPRVLGIGPTVTANLRSTTALVETARELGDMFLLLGGPLCASPGMHRVAERLGVDGFVAGDGESGACLVLESMRSGRSISAGAGLWLGGRIDPVPHREEDMDALPLPARDLLTEDYHASARRQIASDRMTIAFLSRGCPYACTFCAAPLASGRRIRRFSPARVQTEIRSCAEAGYETIIFYDDCLFIRSASLNARVSEFCASISRAGWSGTYQLELRCDAVVAMSDESLLGLRETGCRQVNMGIEKGHVAQLKQFRKALEPEVAREACERLVAAGIRAVGTFIVGGRGETREDLGKTVDFACELDLDLAHFNPLAIYPGTQLFAETFGEQDWYSLCTDEDWAPFGDILWRSDKVSLSDVLAAVAVGYEAFYSEARLQRVLSRTPPHERAAMTQAYRILAKKRGHSWDARGAQAQC